MMVASPCWTTIPDSTRPSGSHRRTVPPEHLPTLPQTGVDYLTVIDAERTLLASELQDGPRAIGDGIPERHDAVSVTVGGWAVAGAAAEGPRALVRAAGRQAAPTRRAAQETDSS